MGKGIRAIKAVGIAGRLQRRIEARIADAAAVIVHCLAGAAAADAGRSLSGTRAALTRQQDFSGGVKKGTDGNCLHRGRLQRS